MDGESIIELSGVTIAPEAAPVRVLLRDVNWSVAPGEFWVVGGEPGCGKTLLLATAAGLHRPTAGTVRIFGRALAEAGEGERVDWRRRIGFVFENEGRLFNQLTVAENVALPLRYHLDLDAAAARAQVAELLALAELSDYADLPPSRLNRRLHARVGLVRALAVPTQVLFLDNPLRGVLASGAQWWLEFLRNLPARQRYQGAPLTVVASSDDFGPWQEQATRFALIQDGQLRMVNGRRDLAAGKG